MSRSVIKSFDGWKIESDGVKDYIVTPAGNEIAVDCNPLNTNLLFCYFYDCNKSDPNYTDNIFKRCA